MGDANEIDDFDAAATVFPGGITSNARALDYEEIHFARSNGSKVYDRDGREFIDYVCAWGPIILGHCDEDVNRHVHEQLRHKDLHGIGTNELEIEAANVIRDRVPVAERVLFGVTGSEIIAHAIRAARSITGRDKIVKFQGCYHGWYDPIATNVLSDEADLGNTDPSSGGILDESLESTIVLPYNDPEAVERAFREHGDQIAAVILEPVAHFMGCVRPNDEFLDRLREITAEHDSLLIFDEIITTRHDFGGVQKLEGVTPDFAAMGKSIANGYPVSALCGKAKYMNEFATHPAGNVHFGGTFNGHVGSMAAVIATMTKAERLNAQEEMASSCDRLVSGLEEIIEDRGLEARVQQYRSAFCLYFSPERVTDYQDVLDSRSEPLVAYRERMFDQGILMVPRDAKRDYLMASHSEDDISRTIECADAALESVEG